MTATVIKLVNGKIPPNAECPFKNECDIVKFGCCNHNGINHNVPFSCAMARFFEITQK